MDLLVDFSGVGDVVGLALTGFVALALESPREADWFLTVLWVGHVMSVDHSRDAGVSTL